MLNRLGRESKRYLTAGVPVFYFSIVCAFREQLFDFDTILTVLHAVSTVEDQRNFEKCTERNRAG